MIERCDPAPDLPPPRTMARASHRAGTAVPAAGCRGRCAGRRRPGGPYRREAGRRRAPGGARTADHPQPIICARLGSPTGAVSELLRQLRVVHARREERVPPDVGRRPRPRRGQLDRHREDVATYRDGLVGHASARGQRPRSPADCPLSARSASGWVPGARAWDGQRKCQTARPDSRTRRPTTPPANPYSFLGTCQQWSAFQGADAQDAARINLPADSPTV